VRANRIPEEHPVSVVRLKIRDCVLYFSLFMVYESQTDHTIIPDYLTTLVNLEKEKNFYKTCNELYFVFSIKHRALN